MKHLYLLLTAMLCCIAITNAQTRFWVGPATGGAWNNTSNWAATSNGTSGQSVPNANTFDVVFDKSVALTVDIASFSLNTLTITNASAAFSTVTLSSPAVATTITLVSSSTAAPAVKVTAGNTLETFAAVAGYDFQISLPAAAYGQIQGTWAFKGSPSVPGFSSATGYVNVPSVTGQGTKLDVEGTIRIDNDQGFVNCEVPEYIEFKTAGQFISNRNGGTIPRATWATTSTLTITGCTTAITTIKLPASGQGTGNIIINCPGLLNAVSLNLPTTLKVNGNFQVVSTNNQLVSLGFPSAQPVIYTFDKNLEIGNNCIVALAPNANYTYGLQLNGNFVQTGGAFYLRNAGGSPALSSTLYVAGNITQTAGTFGNLSAATSTTTDYFVVELNGSVNQNISLSSGTIDNAGNEVTLRLNNAAGATLTAPLSVGKISWNSANKGNLTTTSTNILTINNSSLANTLVVNSPSNAGFVNGPVVRHTAVSGYYSFPTGKSGVLRAAEIKPAAATASVYSAEYFATAYTDLSVLAPVTGVSNQEYWDISKTSGSDASIRLTLAGAVSGAGVADAVMVGHYNGSAWEKVNGTKITPGNEATGSVESAVMTSFSPFTFVYAPMAALPIYLLDFTARKDGTAAKLNWTITQNSTPERFEILRSLNGSDFTLAGTVSGAAQKWNYAFADNNLPAGTTYYRLRMIDVNGSVQLSKVVAVVNGNRDVLITAIYPTIVISSARLDISAGISGTMKLVVTDINGRIVLQQSNNLVNGNQQVSINHVAGLSKGTYHVIGYLSNGTRTAAIRFIKQ